ncbi:Arylesterase precursor [Pseudoalteromonas sp. THAF3]|uniref:arylesterase n=1 Tax=Pseudoalteromonas sp. THAF3 TaxID=2587843 RepID=UPI001267987B|nr:arylesterase [Pseudoalteromonas sp. THAF3]QFU05116.1 Arylesterase precursor [Pseudoalteromonas sp. THAF3]
MSASILRVFIVLLLVTKPLFAWADNQILVLGDSLSAAYGLKQHQGWVQLLQDTYEQQNTPTTLINASISGETTGGALRRLDATLKEHTPTHVLIELGGNDGLRGFPVTKMKANLQALIDKSREAGAEVALMQIRIPPNYGRRYTELFEQSFVDVAKEKQVTLMPFFVEQVATNGELMQNDNIHPNAEAQPILRDIMKTQISNWLNK